MGDSGNTVCGVMELCAGSFSLIFGHLDDGYCVASDCPGITDNGPESTQRGKTWGKSSSS